MYQKQLSFAIIIVIIFISSILIGCAKGGSEISAVACNTYEAYADSAVAAYYKTPTKAKCDSAREALKEAAPCDASYQNEYTSFPACP